MDTASTFESYKILCLEHRHSSLYAELIQTVARRGVVWVRPLALRVSLETWSPNQAGAGFAGGWADLDSELYDLRQSSDLLWPTALFREALDTEVVPLLARLGSQKHSAQGDRQAQEQFRQFIHQVWQDHAGLFPD